MTEVADRNDARTTPDAATLTGPVAHIPQHVWDYALNQEDLIKAAEELRAYLYELARAVGITVHTIEGRAKALASYEAKSTKTTADGSPKYQDPASEIYDCVAARAIVFTTGERDDLVELITHRTAIFERVNPGLLKFNGYDSEHLIVTALTDDDARVRYPALARYLVRFPGLEIQVRSVAAHAWAEYEHDVRYKPGPYQDLLDSDRKQIDQWFVEAGGMRRVMDSLFSQIEERLYPDRNRAPVRAPAIVPADDTLPPPDEDSESTVSDDIELTEEESDPTPLDDVALSELVSVRYPDGEVGERSDVEVIVSRLHALEVETIGEVEAALTEVESERVSRLMDYGSDTTGIRKLDDELLAAFAQRYVDAEQDPERAQILRLRLKRVGGKFAIYSVLTVGGGSPPISAARALRMLAALVAALVGPSGAEVAGIVSERADGLNPSARARPVRGRGNVVFVATNLTRANAEGAMGDLIDRIPGSGVSVLRAGDVLFEASER